MRLCQCLRRQGRHRYEALGLSGSEETEGTTVVWSLLVSEGTSPGSLGVSTGKFSRSMSAWFAVI